jgi:hypothetical protein
MHKTMKLLIAIIIIMVIVINGGCSGGTEESRMVNEEGKAEYDSAVLNMDNSKSAESNSTIKESKPINSGASLENINVTNQMIIYNAHIQMEVKDYIETRNNIGSLIVKMNGYIANSSTNKQHNGNLEGSLTIRIPKENFNSFIDELNVMSHKVHNQTIDGQDVTEEFVDLTSRLKSKQVVEQRLLKFLSEAKKTEDLLKISADLGRIQEEIEQIKGRVNYLQNHVSLSTIHISMFENKVIVPTIEENELNTLEKTRKQFINSIQFIINLSSGIFIFLIGNSPILFLLGSLVVAVIFWVKRNRSRNKNSSEVNKTDL